MTVLNSLKFVSYSPANNSTPEVLRRRKLITKIEEQLALAANVDYQPKQIKRIKDAEGNIEKVEVAKRVCARIMYAGQRLTGRRSDVYS